MKLKRVFIVLIIVTGFSTSYAQELGLRFGNVTGGDVAIDGIFSTGKFSRLHADVSFSSSVVGVDLLWDFLYRPISGEAFNWYLGAGPYTYIGDIFQLGVVGEIGLEYHFNGVPIAIGGDWRPYFRLIDGTHVGWNGFGLNVRYVF